MASTMALLNPNMVLSLRSGGEPFATAIQKA
jgi:hypothetical protein